VLHLVESKLVLKAPVCCSAQILFGWEFAPLALASIERKFVDFPER
jgi:hypothetical protein